MDPFNYIDPMGEFRWRLDEKGRVIAISEKGDTREDLQQKIGYPIPFLSKILEEWSRTSFGRDLNDLPLPEGIEFDVTDFIPSMFHDALKLQAEKGIANTKHDLHGYGNCYGFVMLWYGETFPRYNRRQYVPVQNMFGNNTKPRQSVHRMAPGTSDSFFKSNQLYYLSKGIDIEGLEPLTMTIYPKEGLVKYLAKGTEIKPEDVKFGDIAVFINPDPEIAMKSKIFSKLGGGYIYHAAIVLGTSRDGKEVYLIQKNNEWKPYSVSLPEARFYGERKGNTVRYYRPTK